MKLERDLLLRLVTVSRIARSWTKLFNQYILGPCFQMFVLHLIQTTKKFEIQGRYHNDWPIRDALKLQLKYTSDWEKKKESRKIEANLKKALNVKD